MNRSNWIGLLTVLVIAELAGSLETTMVFAALPAAMRAFGRPEVSWLATGYLLVAGASAAVCGRLGDLFGRGRVLMIVLGLAMLGSVVAALSTDLVWIIIGRSIQGLAGAILPLGYGIAREFLPPARLPLGTGVLTAAASLGAALGFVLGGVIVDHGHWQQVFVWSAAIALAGLLVCLVTLPRSPVRGTSKDIDIIGGVLFAPSIAMLLMAVSLMQSGKTLTLALGLGIGGALGLVFWIGYELRHPRPLIDVRLLRLPQIALVNVIGATVAMGAYQILIFFPLLMQQPASSGIGFGLTATLAGVLKLPSNIAAVIGASGAGVIASRYGGAAVLLVGTLLCTIAWIGLLIDATHIVYVIAMLCLSSAGATIILAGMASVIMATIADERTSEATGVTIVIRMIFQALGAALIGAVMANWLIVLPHGDTHRYFAPESFQAAILTIACASILGVVAAVLLLRITPGRDRATSQPVAPVGSPTFQPLPHSGGSQ